MSELRKDRETFLESVLESRLDVVDPWMVYSSRYHVVKTVFWLGPRDTLDHKTYFELSQYSLSREDVFFLKQKNVPFTLTALMNIENEELEFA